MASDFPHTEVFISCILRADILLFHDNDRWTVAPPNHTCSLDLVLVTSRIFFLHTCGRKFTTRLSNRGKFLPFPKSSPPWFGMIYSSALWSWHLENQLTGHSIVLFRNPACDSRSDMAGWFFKITSDCLSLSPQEAKPWEEAPPPCPLSLFANWTCTKLDIKSSTGFKCLFESLMLLYPSLQRRQCHPTPVLLPGKSHGRRSLVGCGPRGH